jgi:chemotaxis signal transduction protein
VFAEATQAIVQYNREIVVILDHEVSTLAVTVDGADVVETILEDDLMDLPALLSREGAAVVSRMARREGSDDLLLVLDTGKLFPDQPAEPETAALRA